MDGNLHAPAYQTQASDLLLMPSYWLSLIILIIDQRGKNEKERTQNAYNILPSTNLHRNSFVTFPQCSPLRLENVYGGIMHYINDVAQSPGILKWQEVNQEPAKSGWAQLHQCREHIIAKEHHFEYCGATISIPGDDYVMRSASHQVARTPNPLRQSYTGEYLYPQTVSRWNIRVHFEQSAQEQFVQSSA